MYWDTYDALSHNTLYASPILDLLPDLGGLERQESHNQEVVRHILHYPVPRRPVVIPGCP